MLTNWIIIGVYLSLLVLMGVVFGRVNKNTSDYFRGGQRGTWWLVGMSMLMAGVSARTFTGNAGVGFEAGFTFLLLYVGNLIAFPVEFFFLSVRFRRLRATTIPEIIRERFGASTEQFAAYLRMITGVVFSAAWLWGLAIFVSSVFGYPMTPLIIILGVVVILYATTGGSWAVMGNDFVQGLIMISMCILLAVLSLKAVGGFDGMMELIREQGLTEQLALVKSNEVGTEFFKGKYNVAWVITLLVISSAWNLSMGGADKYFSAKNEAHARGLCAFRTLSSLLLMFIFLIPILTARLLYSDRVAGLIDTGLSKPAEGAFAITSLELLPGTLVTLMVIAMFAASLSSLDTGMNRNAAMFMTNILPPIRRAMGKNTLSPARSLVLSKLMTVIFGIIIISAALYMSKVEGKGMFEILLKANSILTPPLLIPMLFGLFWKRGWKWSAVIAICAGFVPGIYSLFNPDMGWVPLTWAVMGTTAIAYLLTIPFDKHNPADFNESVSNFFLKMQTPIDFENEVGEGNDAFQMKVIGSFALVIGTFVLLLQFLPENDPFARKCIASVSGMIYLVGIPLFLLGCRGMKLLKAEQEKNV